MVKVDLITGFLGSGKTTFLLKYADYLMRQGLKIGILEYDHGAVNVDMLLLQKLRGPQCETEMLSAACDADCHRRRFRTKLISMGMSGYDRVIIEPSGVFDVDEFFDALREYPLEDWYDIASVITVVDAKLGDTLPDEAEFLLASQAANAGKILLSRTQLATPEEISATEAHLKNAVQAIGCRRSMDELLETKPWDEFTDDDFKALANCGYRISSYVKRPLGEHSDFDSVYFLDLPMTHAEIETKVKELFATDDYGHIFRVKGFFEENGQWYQVNAEKNGVTISPIPVGQYAMIVIGTDLQEEKVKALINRK